MMSQCMKLVYVSFTLLVLGYPVTGGFESLRLPSDVREKMLIMDPNNPHAAVDWCE